MPDAYGEQLAAWGKVVLLETTGRVTGRTARAPVGFVAEPDRSLLVAAGRPKASWAANLFANPECHCTIGEVRTAYRAEELDGADRARAITELILKYGTPAESLGGGPAFRLRPTGEAG
jgi:deazaflavin-dependent oxidoreductase (nitroreductase family)